MSAPAISPGILRRLDWRRTDAEARSRWLRSLRPAEPLAAVAGIVDAVRDGGDRALLAHRERLDRVPPGELWASEDEFESAAREVPASLVEALERAAGAIRRYHTEQHNALRARRVVQTAPGVVVWRRWVALRRVGGYVPAGRAPLVSTVLMIGIPAAIAGVDELIIASPPDALGRVAPGILVAARLAGAGRVLKVGGAHAIAALAYGTESVPVVDRIVGPGGPWVNAAKRLVAADVAIDVPAGPSECVVLADGDADPRLVALDLLAQAEHGPDSVAVLVTDAPDLVAAVDDALQREDPTIAAGGTETLRRNGHAVVVGSLAEGLALAEAIAPEHLSLQCREAEALAEQVRCAGSVSIGGSTPVAAGDYAVGANHLLPTGGAARAWSGLGIETFGRWVQFQQVRPEAASPVAAVVGMLADAEGMPAHAASVAARAGSEASAPKWDAALMLRPLEAPAPYPVEESDEDVAADTGIPAGELLRADLNLLGGPILEGPARALAAYPASELRTYGDMTYRELRRVLGERVGVAPGRVIIGAGADELIRLITRLAAGDGDAVVVPTPTFGMFSVEAELAGARVVTVPRRDLAVRQTPEELRDAAAACAARLVWICTPNNPTGDLYPLDEVRQVAASLPALVAVDEVYLEFAAADAGVPASSLSAVALQAQLPNVIVLRSLSKAYGLANARVGYAIVSDELASRFDAARLPLAVSGPAIAVALGALADADAARERQAMVVAERRRLTAAIEARGWSCLPSVANFVTFRPDDAGRLSGFLRGRGIVVRTYADGPMAGWLRISAGDAVETDRILDALEAHR
ncbi:MAG TPA: histidinol dehydrogenase [candidate division Zixibacteria bacterium]|nr:histidinol dehydrogenase [candidate division Zixibacteria bacterium]